MNTPTYHLQKYNGPSTRYTCPSCGAKHRFTRYVDAYGRSLHPSVGRCDRESACGYHKTPRDYFAEHPVEKKVTPVVVPEAKPKELCVIPGHYVTRSVRPDRDSAFTTFLGTLFDPLVVEMLVVDYRLGVTSDGDVIFFQLDLQGRCRTGKIMKYNPQTGHRIKDPATPHRIDWVHSRLKYAGKLPASWTLTQCLFGEHLLSAHPDKTVALVESEKTAVICAGILPKFLWLATGGKSQLGDKLLVLQGRKIVAFPDVDGFELWSQKLSNYVIPGLTGNLPTGHLDVTVSPILQQNATPEDIENHIDIADWLIRENLSRHSGLDPESPDRASQTLATILHRVPIPTDLQPNLLGLIADFELEYL